MLVGLYAFIGFRIAPGLLRSQAIESVRATYGRELRIGEVRVQPFKLQLEVRDLEFPDRDRQPMLSLRRLFVDFEVSSIRRRAWVVRDLDLEGPACAPCCAATARRTCRIFHRPRFRPRRSLRRQRNPLACRPSGSSRSRSETAARNTPNSPDASSHSCAASPRSASR